MSSISKKRQLMKKKRQAKPREDHFPGGRLFVDEEGVTIFLKGPLQEFSGCLPWRYVPQGIAILRMVSDPDCPPDGYDSYERIEDKARSVGINPDDIEYFLGWDGTAVLKAVESVGNLSDWCPFASLANEIQRVRTMKSEDLRRYTEPILG